MFFISCDDLFIRDKVISLFIDSNPIFTSQKNQKYFCKIYLSYKKDKFKFSLNNDFQIFNCPIEFNIIYASLISQLNNYSIKLINLNYYPISGEVRYNNSFVKLNFIHNTIFNSLLLSKEGVNKIDLYKKIWPNDVNISLNKLDTHLTNLKNILSSNFNCNINFQSSSGIQKLVIN
jgi:hypothetical protein